MSEKVLLVRGEIHLEEKTEEYSRRKEKFKQRPSRHSGKKVCFPPLELQTTDGQSPDAFLSVHALSHASPGIKRKQLTWGREWAAIRLNKENYHLPIPTQSPEKESGSNISKEMDSLETTFKKVLEERSQTQHFGLDAFPVSSNNIIQSSEFIKTFVQKIHLFSGNLNPQNCRRGNCGEGL